MRVLRRLLHSLIMKQERQEQQLMLLLKIRMMSRHQREKWSLTGPVVPVLELPRLLLKMIPLLL